MTENLSIKLPLLLGSGLYVLADFLKSPLDYYEITVKISVLLTSLGTIYAFIKWGFPKIVKAFKEHIAATSTSLRWHEQFGENAAEVVKKMILSQTRFITEEK